jgi:hypothetical protein
MPDDFNLTIKALMKRLNKAGDNVLPCLTPLHTANCIGKLEFHRTVTNSLLYQQHKTFTITGGTPAANKELNKLQ